MPKIIEVREEQESVRQKNRAGKKETHMHVQFLWSMRDPN